MLKKVRITLAVLFWVLITAMLLDFTGTLHHWLGWMAKVQFLPAFLALNVAVVVGLVVMTLLFGRVYCSVICPMGVFQDIVSNLSARRKGKKRRFSYKAPNNLLRYGVLALFVILMVAGFVGVAAIVAPYSAYGRIVTSLGQPVVIWINNLLAELAEHYGSYAVYEREIWLRSASVLAVAVVTLIVVVTLSWLYGRRYCNTICPVGTILGFLSRLSWMRPVIDTDKCIDCGSCARKCKSECIDAVNHKIDLSRCVACMDCIEECSRNAISFTSRRPKVAVAGSVSAKADSKVSAGAASETSADSAAAPDKSRRGFIITGALAAGAALTRGAEKTVDGGLAVIEDKKIPERHTKVVPAGAGSLKNFYQHCTACQLCVSKCPSGVLRPSGGVATFMQPEMQFERGYCRPECTACSDVCPAGAIRPISWEDKSSTQIGHAVWIPANCVVNTDGVECGNCARHCQVGAIMMVPSDPGNPDSLKIPAVDETRCIGCGACENLCPARPFSAIYVEGLEVHRMV